MPARRRKAISQTTGNNSSGSVLRRSTNKSVLRKRGSIVSLETESLLIDKLKGNPKAELFRDGKYLHVSDLLSKCVRKIALAKVTNYTMTNEATWDNTHLVYVLGHAIQKYVTDKIILTSPEELFGEWVCNCGQFSIQGTAEDSKKSKVCNSCGLKPSSYKEIVLINEYLGVIGSVDITLRFDGAYYLNEVKSIKKESWETLRRPLPIHILQVVFYWWLAKELGLPLHKQVSVLYVCKTFTMSSPFKEFTLNPEDHLYRLEDYFEDALSLKEALTGGELPVRICPDPSSPMAKRCELCAICFNM